MFTSQKQALSSFADQVPPAGSLRLIVAAHSLISRQLLEFIKMRVSATLFAELQEPREDAFLSLVFLARALAERDDCPISRAQVLWPALKQLDQLRTAALHTWTHNDALLEDPIRNFIRSVYSDKASLVQSIPPEKLLQSFWYAAGYLNTILAIERLPAPECNAA